MAKAVTANFSQLASLGRQGSKLMNKVALVEMT
jgi:hypothetical protein